MSGVIKGLAKAAEGAKQAVGAALPTVHHGESHSSLSGEAAKSERIPLRWAPPMLLRRRVDCAYGLLQYTCTGSVLCYP